ncbi:MAG: hypothetical protein WDO13_15470 [Verrucomicrobiota bacterium]
MTLATDDSGVVIDAGGMGTFHLDYPELIGSAPHKIIARTLNGASATIDYDNGAKVTVDGHDPSRIVYTFSGLPADANKAKVTMIIDFSYQQGGRWKIGAKAGTFPAEKPPQPHLYAGNETHFELTDAQGQTLALRTPDYGWLELNDNREWNWSVYSFQTQFPLLPGVASYTIELGQGATTAGKPAPIVDEFGQIAAGDWPGKLYSADELKADVESEKTYYAGLTPPARDAFGGLPGSGGEARLVGQRLLSRREKGRKVDPGRSRRQRLFPARHLRLCAGRRLHAGRRTSPGLRLAAPARRRVRHRLPAQFQGRGAFVLPGQHHPQVRRTLQAGRIPDADDRPRAPLRLQLHRRVLPRGAGRGQGGEFSLRRAPAARRVGATAASPASRAFPASRKRGIPSTQRTWRRWTRTSPPRCPPGPTTRCSSATSWSTSRFTRTSRRWCPG